MSAPSTTPSLSTPALPAPSLLTRLTRTRGRTGRRDFWLGLVRILLLWLSLGVLLLIGTVMTGFAASPAVDDAAAWGAVGQIGFILNVLLACVAALPLLALGVRRLHDMDLPGWWLLVPVALLAVATILRSNPAPSAALLLVIDVVAAAALLVLGSWPGTATANRFGPADLS